MASQYLVKRGKNGKYDIYMRDLVSYGEYSARFKHLHEDCGLTPEQTAIELYHMVAQFFQKNEKPTELDMCERYIFDTMDPGDIITIENQVWVVNRSAIA